jgi:hypothetical protein
MTKITLTQLKKCKYDNIPLKALFYKAFRVLKIQLLALLASFSPYFRRTATIPHNKKTQKPLYFLPFRALAFSLIKTNNPRILYIFISLTYLKSSFPVLSFLSFSIKPSPLVLRKALYYKGFKRRMRDIAPTAFIWVNLYFITSKLLFFWLIF